MLLVVVLQLPLAVCTIFLLALESYIILYRLCFIFCFFLLYKYICISIHLLYMSFVTLLSSSLPFLRVKEFTWGRGSSLVFDFEWLEFGAKPRRIRYYILFQFAREIIISMRALRALMKFPISVAQFTPLWPRVGENTEIFSFTATQIAESRLSCLHY